MFNVIEIKKECIGGSFSTVTQYEEDSYKGEKLGTAIRDDEEIVTEAVDHIETVTASEIVFSEGRIAKNKVKSLVWERDCFGTASVRYVRMAANCAY